MDAPAFDASGLDAADSPDAAPVDAAPACRSNGDCPGASLCSSLLRRCVECTADPDCSSDRPVCSGGVCVVRAVCASSRTCPGEVCDPTAQSCVRCSVDVDCDPGQRCLTHACVTDTPCRSSAQCSQLGMVCDTAAGRCADCAADIDCGSGAFCSATGLCHRLVCVPSSAVCVDTMTLRACDARGAAAVTSPCAAGQSCVDGRCVMRVCAPGTAECVDGTRLRVCRADGLGFDSPATCADGQVCSAGSCRTQVCAPGEPGGCIDATTARVCAADGLGYGNVICPTTANAPGRCLGDRCALLCASGYGSCDGSDANGCEVNLLGSNVHCGACGHACASGERCSNGVCASTGLCPSSCSGDLDCNSCRVSSDPATVRYCCFSGLCISMTSACPSGSPDGGIPTDTGTIDAGTGTDTGMTSPG
jgi:hypothetical protein